MVVKVFGKPLSMTAAAERPRRIASIGLGRADRLPRPVGPRWQANVPQWKERGRGREGGKERERGRESEGGRGGRREGGGERDRRESRGESQERAVTYDGQREAEGEREYACGSGGGEGSSGKGGTEGKVSRLSEADLASETAKFTARKLTQHAYLSDEDLERRRAAASDPDTDGGHADAWLSRWRERAAQLQSVREAEPAAGAEVDAPPKPAAKPAAKRPTLGADGMRVARRPRQSMGILPSAATDATEAAIAALNDLRAYLSLCGGTEGLVDGWKWSCEERKAGATAGGFDTYFFNVAGKRFRSRVEVARHFQLTPLSAAELRERGFGKKRRV